MKKMIQSMVLLVATTALFSCGHMHKGHGGHESKTGTEAHACTCGAGQTETVKSDAKKESCDHCKKGS